MGWNGVWFSVGLRMGWNWYLARFLFLITPAWIPNLQVDLDADFADLDDDEGSDPVAAAAGSSPEKSGGMFAAFRGLVGGKSLDRSDILPLVDKLRDRLVEKNVAQVGSVSRGGEYKHR